jgi:hypothetical protein
MSRSQANTPKQHGQHHRYLDRLCNIGQQLAADHPDAVRRLVLISTACRLGTVGRELTQHVANLLQSGADRRAMATADCPCCIS